MSTLRKEKIVVPAQIQYWMDELNDPEVSINLKDNTAQKVEELMQVLSSHLIEYHKNRKKFQKRYDRNSRKWK